MMHYPSDSNSWSELPIVAHDGFRMFGLVSRFRDTRSLGSILMDNIDRITGNELSDVTSETWPRPRLKCVTPACGPTCQSSEPV
jgi:hypothetical protein